MDELTMTAPATTRLTVEEFWALPDPPAGEQWQLLDGEVVIVASPRFGHQDTAMQLSGELFLALRGTGAKVVQAPLDVVLGEHTVLQPDLVLYDAGAAAQIDPEAVVPVFPTLVVEILSPSTASLDLVRKRRRYEQAAIPEYWVVSRTEESITVLRLEDGRYVEASCLAPGDTLTSPLFPSVAIAVADVLQPPA